MILREAIKDDIPQMHLVRISVKENQLSNPDLISSKDYEEYLFTRGKGWVIEIDHLIIGFAIVDLIDNNVWALFVHPEYEGRGFGAMLHNKMMDWYFNKTTETIWLSTTPDTKAEQFYKKKGWEQKGLQPNGEARFEMSSENWKNLNR